MFTCLFCFELACWTYLDNIVVWFWVSLLYMVIAFCLSLGGC